ncbi:Epoxide hydrolase-like protein [Gossypium australe]|uniref:Epoxide hydrolase-like protein n=1 Tax=Gossypium australe TaxID=47621 RepID=A0A5B6UU55_9ROSI|nr:Epoxide hydrolase-like protein [Gossypium australe]
MVMKGWMVVEKGRRIVRTAFFMVAMLTSLLASSLPLLAAIGDIMIPFLLLSSFTCVTCYGVYSMCDGPALSHGPYLGTVALCSFVSILVLSVKACVFTVNSQIVAEASSGYSLARQRLHFKKSWGMPVLFLSSVVFALGHIVVAYRTCCRARRKLLFHRVDPEAKVPRSPTPPIGKTPKSDGETRRKPFGQSGDDGEVPIRLLADVDSLFITLQGLTVHYKLCFPGSPPRALSSTTFLEPEVSCAPQVAAGKLKLDRQALSVLSKTQYHHLQRSYSNQFHSSSLYAPLLDVSPTSPVISKDVPVFSLDDSVAQVETSNLKSGTPEKDIEANGQFGIILVHGFGGGVFAWRHVMGVLACHVGCPVAAFDRPGWGLTSRPSRKDWEGKQLPNPYKLETQVDLLLSFCSEVGFSSVVLVGHDDGGILALKAAQKVQASMKSYNITIKAVVLLSVSLSREVVPAFARILLRTSLGKKHLVRPLLRTEITQVVNRRAWYDATKLTTDVLSLYKAPLCVEGWDEALHEIGRLSNETILSPQNATSLLKAVEEMPVLVITGAEDAHISLKSSQAMASKLRLVAISGCGHLPHEECPKALLAAISPFLSRLLLKPELQRRV